MLPRTNFAPGVLFLLASAAALALVPLALPDSYSWVEHTTSEAGGQGVEGAWLARLGFLLFGLGVLWLAYQRRERWGRLAAALHGTFAISMFAVAAFSLRSWEPTASFDATEDFLHSFFATLMGFAFAIGVAVIAIRSWRNGRGLRPLHIAAIAAAIILPIGMTLFGSIDGILQRLMFAIAYLWYAVQGLDRRTE